VPVDFIEKRVRVIGALVADGLVSADGVGPAWLHAKTVSLLASYKLTP